MVEVIQNLEKPYIWHGTLSVPVIQVSVEYQYVPATVLDTRKYQWANLVLELYALEGILRVPCKKT
jgi:hypothetical protein